MQVSRRDLAKLLAVAAGAGLSPWRLEAADGPARLLAFEPLGNVTLLHITDAHATLRPVFYREPDTVLGVGAERGRPPFLTGAELLRAYHIAPGSVEAYACTYLDFPALAARYGRMGGYAHLATLGSASSARRFPTPRSPTLGASCPTSPSAFGKTASRRSSTSCGTTRRSTWSCSSRTTASPST